MAEVNPIPQQLIGFTVFDNEGEVLGITDVGLPDINFMTETIKGAGIAGEVDAPVKGQTQSMTLTLNYRSITPAFLHKSHGAVALTLYGALQLQDGGTNEQIDKQIKIVMRGMTKTNAMGTFDVGVSSKPNVVIETTYLMIAYDGNKEVEIDKLNYIHMVNGTDYLETVRSILGK